MLYCTAKVFGAVMYKSAVRNQSCGATSFLSSSVSAALTEKVPKLKKKNIFVYSGETKFLFERLICNRCEDSNLIQLLYSTYVLTAALNQLRHHT
jgi:hypothetical protein